MDARRQFGDEGESLAVAYLRERGYRILETQARTRLGEIDIICQDRDELVFVEVKTRRGDTFGYPEEAVTAQKIRHVVHAAQAYLFAHPRLTLPWRVDVVAIRMVRNGEPEIVHVPAIDVPEGLA